MKSYTSGFPQPAIPSTLFQCCLSPSSVPVTYFINCKMKWCCPCSLHFWRVCLYNTQPSVEDHFLVDLLLKLHWHWSIGTQMNHQFEVVPIIAARCQASFQKWDVFGFFYFSHSWWTINIQRKNFHKTHTRVCSRHFQRCGQASNSNWAVPVLFFFFETQQNQHE